MQSDQPSLQGERPRRAWPTPAAAGARPARASAFRSAAGRRSSGCRSSRRCATGRAIKDHTLANLDFYLEAFEAQGDAPGGQVHWARDGGRGARPQSSRSAARSSAKTVTKGKSMVGGGDRAQRSSRSATASRRSRPISANTSSSCATRRPSHIIAPAFHLTQGAGRRTFRASITRSTPTARSTKRATSCAEARARAAPQFLAADVGITGANFLVAETGTQRSSSPTKAMAI